LLDLARSERLDLIELGVAGTAAMPSPRLGSAQWCRGLASRCPAEPPASAVEDAVALFGGLICSLPVTPDGVWRWL